MQKVLLFSLLAITLGLGGCDWFRGLLGPQVLREQRVTKVILASPGRQAQQVRSAQQARPAPKDLLAPPARRGLLEPPARRGLLEIPLNK